MGHDLGDFKDIFKGDLHVEYSGNKFIVWNNIESDQILRLEPEEVVTLIKIFRLGLSIYCPELEDEIFPT